MLLDAGEIVRLVRWPGQFPKGVPSSLNPGEKRRPFAAAGVVCSTKLPVMSGERVLVAVAQAIVIGITRVASRWIGEYFIDEDRAARIAEEIDRYRIAIPSVRIDRQVYNSRAAQIRRHAHVNFIQSGHISRSN